MGVRGGAAAQPRSGMARNRAWVAAGGFIAVAVAGGFIVAMRLTADDTGDADPVLVVAASGHRAGFDQEIIDTDPPSGNGCCLDALATGDLDSDGDIDVVVGAENADGLSWYRNPSDGTDSATWERFSIGAGDFTTDVEVADIDADGDLDVVASAIDRNAIEWWESTGDTTTTSGWVRQEIGVDFAHDLVVADLDGDHDLDVGAFHKDASRVDWFEHPDDDSTEWRQHVVDQIDGEGLAVADVDGDGDADLVAGPAIYSNEDGLGVQWHRRMLADDWPAQARPVVGDIDGDMLVDILLSAPETVGRLSWFKAPNWEESVIDQSAGYVHSLELGDVDLDGSMDVFAGEMHFAGDRLIRVLFGDGGSTWTPQVLANTGTHNARLVDLDGDGRLDVVGKNFDGPKVVEVWWNRWSFVENERPSGSADVATPLDGFEYVQVDHDRRRFSAETPYFGLAFGDVDGDGRDDIVSGGYVYSNPGSDLTAEWPRTDIGAAVGAEVDAVLVTDVDGDQFGDIIATALPDVWWIERNAQGDGWTGQIVASVPATSRPNGQGYRLADLTADGSDEVVLSGGSAESDIWYVEIPEDPGQDWPTVRITRQATDEQVGIGDVDGDGLLDVTAGDMHDDGSYIAWFSNPGDGSADWVRHRLGEFPGTFPDRMDAADIDGDGDVDVVVSDENDGSNSDAGVFWYSNPGDDLSPWDRRSVVTQYSTNGLDVADFDGDGDVDVVTGEHKGPLRVAIWENLATAPDGEVQWVEHLVDAGKESHLGARVWDLDGDGDLEIVSIGLDDWRSLHLWVND